MKTIQVFAIEYWNGEDYDDHWSGILVSSGIFATEELAEKEIKRLQIEHDHRIKEEIEEGYVFPSNEKETWKVVPIDFHS